MFADLKQELVQLLEKGIKVRVGEKIETIHVAISSICGDNLGKMTSPICVIVIANTTIFIGIYELLGFKMNFNNNCYVCRFCGSTGKPQQVCACVAECDCDPSHDIQDITFNHLLVAEDDDSQGVVRPFSLIGSTELTRQNSAPPDPMHDLTEGVLPSALSFLLNFSVAFGLLAREDIELRFKNFGPNFYEGSPVLKVEGTVGPRSRVVCSITGKAIQVSRMSFQYLN